MRDWPSWKGAASGVWSIVAVALATVVAADLALQRCVPPLPRRMEAVDGFRDVAAGDPETLVIASSHGRSFVGISDEVARARGRRAMAVIPIENGKLTTYEWALEHRLAPLFGAGGPLRAHQRPSLARFVLVTEWWDSCSPAEGPLSANVPGRVFALGDFLADAAHNGLNSWNLNYVDFQWSELLRRSILASDRGVGRLQKAMHRRREPPEAELGRATATWRAMVEAAHTDPRCHDGHERAALDRILDWAQGRGLDVTLLLFPRKPASLSPRARETTIKVFTDEMRALAARRRLRFIDYTSSTPIDDDDFMADFDHLNAQGNDKFKRWALDRDLAFLLQPPTGGPAGGKP